MHTLPLLFWGVQGVGSDGNSILKSQFKYLTRSRSLFNVLKNTMRLQQEARELQESREDGLHWQDTDV